jgi:hypothetical protein
MKKIRLLVFYDCSELTYEASYGLLCDCLAATGAVPSDLWYETVVVSTGRVVDFNTRAVRNLKLLRKWLAEPHLVGIGASVSNGQELRSDFEYHHWTIQPFGLSPLVSICFDPTKFPTVSTAMIRDWIRRMLTKTGVAYGFCCDINKSVMPLNYVLGANFQPAQFPYEVTNSWFDELPNHLNDGNGLARYRKGFQRLVYPINVLNTAQVEANIGCGSLSTWISQEQSRGSLTRLDSDHWLWEVGEEQLLAVNVALASNGLLISGSAG